MNPTLYDEPREGSETLLHNVVYCSRIAPGVTEADVQAIVATARRYNPAHGLTGLLVYGSDVFFQWLEGPKESVVALMNNIRHPDGTQACWAWSAGCKWAPCSLYPRCQRRALD